jgi:hypothetical protein
MLRGICGATISVVCHTKLNIFVACSIWCRNHKLQYSRPLESGVGQCSGDIMQIFGFRAISIGLHDIMMQDITYYSVLDRTITPIQS